MPNFDIGKLNSMYRSAEQADSRLFSEMKSNVRLVAGDHYLKGVHKDLDRTRHGKRLASDTKLRLTQNHISKASNMWVNSIANDISGIEIVPNNSNELKDKKAAQLFSSVKEYLSKEQDFDSKVRKLAKDFFDIGEAIVKIYFDPATGPLTDGPIQQGIDPTTGQPVLYQEQIPAGSIKFERILPFDLLRDPSAKDWDECRWVIYRKMMDKDILLSMFSGEQNDDVRRNIQESSEQTFKVYASSDNSYGESKKVLVNEFYFRPSAIYPKGYFYIATLTGILYQGELPNGVFPIEIVNFDDVPTVPRGNSKIKQLRPIQAEINRAVSKMAEHQVTLGDDKILIPAGSKIQESNKIAGVRAIQVAGMDPTILPGRAGDQYLTYWLKQVEQFYMIAEIPEIDEDKIAQMDPMAIMYRGMREKKKFSYYSEKFEKFLIKVWEKALKLYKFHVHPMAALPAIGASEKINLDELKSSEDMNLQIKIKRRANDPESMIGKHMALTQLLQYAGDKLSDIDVGEIAANLPFLDKDSFIPEARAKYDRATNLILKLDKGIDIRISSHDDPGYMIRRLDRRMSESDFDDVTYSMHDGQVVPTEHIHALYGQKREEYMELEMKHTLAQQAKDMNLIPTTGAPVKVQLQTNELKSDGSGYRSMRLEFPHDTLMWLKDMLMKQGMSEQTVSGHHPATQADLNAGMAGQEAMYAAQQQGLQDSQQEQMMHDQLGQPPQILGR